MHPNAITDCHTHRPAPDGIAGGTPQQVRHWIAEMPDVAFSVGIHPWIFANGVPTEIDSIIAEVEALATDSRIVAIGEAGIDRLHPMPEMQRHAFHRQVEISEASGKPLILHVVKAIDDIISLRRLTKARQPWIWHGFRGKPQQASQILKADTQFYISLGEKFNAETAKAIPANRLLIETDESRLSINEIAAIIAATRNTSEKQLITVAQQNLTRILARPAACQGQSC